MINNWFWLLQLLIATLLGTAIGYERKLRIKEAGMRTHALVSLGACLMMIISLNAFGNGVDGDRARIAAQIVSGIGFLGAGMIMFKREGGLQGLTTAAGIWVTAGVGMAIGGGMYVLGAGAAILIILIQFLLHLPFQFLKTKKLYLIKVVFENQDGANEKLSELFNVKRFTKLKAEKEGDKTIYTTVMLTQQALDIEYIDKVLKENSYIKSIERIEDD